MRLVCGEVHPYNGRRSPAQAVLGQRENLFPSTVPETSEDDNSRNGLG